MDQLESPFSVSIRLRLEEGVKGAGQTCHSLVVEDCRKPAQLGVHSTKNKTEQKRIPPPAINRTDRTVGHSSIRPWSQSVSHRAIHPSVLAELYHPLQVGRSSISDKLLGSCIMKSAAWSNLTEPITNLTSFGNLFD